MSKQITGIVGWLKNWFYDESEVDGFVTTLQNSINSKLNSNLTEANKNLVTNGSGTVVLEDKPVIPDVSGKIDTAGTGLSKSGTTLNHSNSVTALTTSGLKKIKHDAQGHITETANPNTSDLPNSETYANLGSNLTNQKLINDAINSKIGALTGIEFIVITTNKGTASADTMNKLYVVSENSKVNYYYTKRSGTSPNYTYSWEELDANIVADVSWNSVTGKPSTFPPSSHSHSINDVNNLQTTLNGKAPTSHASSENTYGLGTTSNYGHNKVINDLNHDSFGNGESLSAYQGYVLRNAINGKQDEITSIVLVPKSTDANGKIIFYTGDEPT